MLSIASAGDNCLALLAEGAEVVAADLSAAQLACLELRCAAFRRLDYDDVQAAWKAAFLTPVYTRFVQQLVRAAPEIGLTGFGRVDPMTLFTFDTQTSIIIIPVKHTKICDPFIFPDM